TELTETVPLPAGHARRRVLHADPLMCVLSERCSTIYAEAAIVKKMIEELYQLQGKTAVVTGAGRGIGLAVADLFAAAGARIVVADILAVEAEAAAAEICKNGGEALAVTVDIADETAVKQLYAQATQRFSSVDILVHCAA